MPSLARAGLRAAGSAGWLLPCLLGAAACAENGRALATATTGSGAPSAAVAATADLGALATFADTESGFAIDYPAGWYKKEIEGGVILMSIDPFSGAGPGGGSTINVLRDRQAPRTLDAFASDSQKLGTITRHETWELPGGTKAARLDLSTYMGANAVLYAVFGDHPVIVNGYGDFGPFDAIARTLRPAP